MAVDIWEGALAPESYKLVISSAEDDDVDLSTVTAASFVVRSPTGTESTWTSSWNYSAETGALTLTYTFDATESELDEVGMWLVYATLLSGDGALSGAAVGVGTGVGEIEEATDGGLAGTASGTGSATGTLVSLTLYADTSNVVTSTTETSTVGRMRAADTSTVGTTHSDTA